MIASATTPNEVRYVCRHMRERSREEMFLLRADDDADALADALAAVPGVAWCAYHGGRPAAVIGAYPMHPGVWGLFGFGTDDYRHVMVEVTKHARRVMMPVVAAVAHRAQCLSPVGHEETQRWLRFLGAREEARLRAYGKGGEDVILFAWWRDDDVRR